MTNRLAGKRVLIVEDEHIIAIDLAHELAAAGAKIIGPVATVGAALDLIASTDPDGVILDLDLRGKIAFPIADALANRHIPFIFSTGYDCEIPARHTNVPRVTKPAPTSAVCLALEEAISTAPRKE
jgi:CheY-like chemotaxis protein